MRVQRLNNMLEFFRQYLSAIDYYHACFIHIETVIDIERFDLHTSNESTERFYVSCQRIEQIVFNVICFCSIWDNRNWSQCDTGYGVYLRWRWRSRSDAGTSLPPKLSTLKAKVNFNSDSGRLQQRFWQVYWCTYKLIRLTRNMQLKWSRLKFDHWLQDCGIELAQDEKETENENYEDLNSCEAWLQINTTQ